LHRVANLRPFTVVFVLSTNYAGSHLLAQLIGAHSRCLSIGELRNFEKLRQRARTDRNVVSDYASNPLFAGLDACPPEAWHRRIFENAQAHRPGVTTLVDNSKRIEWAARCAKSADVRAVYVHLLRDPRALVRRWRATYGTRSEQRSQRRRLARRRPGRVVSALFAPIEIVYALKWLETNRSISEFCARRGPCTTVLYEELARDPRAALARLMPALGLDYEPGQLEYGRVAHAGTLKREYLGASARSLVAVDERWRDELAAGLSARIVGMPALREYVASLGLTLDDGGLRRAGVTASR
jgi:hypothetical protein